MNQETYICPICGEETGALSLEQLDFHYEIKHEIQFQAMEQYIYRFINRSMLPAKHMYQGKLWFEISYDKIKVKELKYLKNARLDADRKSVCVPLELYDEAGDKIEFVIEK